MCKWGSSVPLPLVIPASLSSTGEAKFTIKDVDACIAPIVKSLNDAGVTTAACCCGHGKMLGNIALADGRELVIMPDYETARKVEALLIEAGLQEPLDAEDTPAQEGKDG